MHQVPPGKTREYLFRAWVAMISFCRGEGKPPTPQNTPYCSFQITRTDTYPLMSHAGTVQLVDKQTPHPSKIPRTAIWQNLYPSKMTRTVCAAILTCSCPFKNTPYQVLYYKAKCSGKPPTPQTTPLFCTHCRWLQNQWLAELLSSFMPGEGGAGRAGGGSAMAGKESPAETEAKLKEHLRLVWPSVGAVRASAKGWESGGCGLLNPLSHPLLLCRYFS